MSRRRHRSRRIIEKNVATDAKTIFIFLSTTERNEKKKRIVLGW